MALTDKAANAAEPRQKPYKIAAGGGLYLLVTPDGRKYWRLKYRFLGKEKLLALGVYPGISIAEARVARDAAKALLKAGCDPVATKKQDRLANQVSAANTFETVALEWIGQQCHRWSPGHVERVRDSIKLDIFPDIGARPIKDITAPELLAVLRKVEKRGVFETAQRLLQRCGAVFRYAIQTHRAEHNPATDLRGAIKQPKRENYAALSATDLPEYLRKLATYDGRLETRLALKLLALTFVRTSELRKAEWSEIDFDKNEWRIPAERMKSRAPHIVPLSNQALAVLEELKPLTGRGRFVFPNQLRLTAPMSENTMLYAIYRMGYHSRATGHGFRATASTILNEQGWLADVIERQLAHAERNKVRAAYNHAEHMPERRKMMQAWADYLDGLKAGADVVVIGVEVGKLRADKAA
ncbi:MAG: tyrosine-type recombinase/integrase [Sulfuricaulis sp.]